MAKGVASCPRPPLPGAWPVTSTGPKSPATATPGHASPASESPGHLGPREHCPSPAPHAGGTLVGGVATMLMGVASRAGPSRAPAPQRTERSQEPRAAGPRGEWPVTGQDVAPRGLTMRAGPGRALAPNMPRPPDTAQPPRHAPDPRPGPPLRPPRSRTQCTWEAGRRVRPPKAVSSRGSRSVASVHTRGPAAASTLEAPSLCDTRHARGGRPGGPPAVEGAGAEGAPGRACSSGRSPQLHAAISSLRVWPARPRLLAARARLRLLLLSTLWLGRLGTTRPRSSPQSRPLLTWPSLAAPEALPRERPPLASLARQSHRELTAVAPQGRVRAPEDPTGSRPPA